jgi:hypothetical protein
MEKVRKVTEETSDARWQSISERFRSFVRNWKNAAGILWQDPSNIAVPKADLKHG